MARIWISTVSAENVSDSNYGQSGARKLRKCFDQFGSGAGHTLAGDPEEADLVIFAEVRDEGPAFEFVRSHPIYRARSQDCFVFSIHDTVIPIVRGIFPSITRRHYDATRTRSGFYLNALDFTPHREILEQQQPQVLAGFAGTIGNHPVRSRVASLRSDEIEVRDTAGLYQIARVAGARVETESLERSYVRDLLRGKFALCPRGKGASSIRIFEALGAGRVPVIISDDWVEPLGPDWNSFSLRVSENDVGKIPDLLRAREIDWPVLAANARRAYQEWFSPERWFDTTVNWCLELKDRSRHTYWHRLGAYRCLGDTALLNYYSRSRIQLLRRYRRVFW